LNLFLYSWRNNRNPGLL